MTEDLDRRSYRIALVADGYVNPPPGEIDAIPILVDCGWGLIQLPSESYGDDVTRLMLEQVAEQAEEFHRRGYDLVLIGEHHGLAPAFGVAGVPLPDQIDPPSADALRDFLRRRPAPAPAGRALPSPRSAG